MNWQTAGITFVGSVISWIAFALCAYVWGKRRLLEFWKRERAKLVAEIHAPTVVQGGIQATSTTQFAGSGLKVNIYGADLSNTGLSAAASWALRRATDPELERLTAIPAKTELGQIEYPTGLAPTPTTWAKRPMSTDPLPKVDVVVMPYTSAEKMANADILTPGVHYADYIDFARDWASVYEPQTTGRSPARFAKCMGSYWVTRIGDKDVLMLPSNLHLSTDGKSMPVKQFVQQICQETGCTTFITTGTAGGVGASEVLGDVVIAKNVKLNLAKSQWENEPYAQQSFPAAPVSAQQLGYLETAFSTLIPGAIGGQLKPSGYADRAPELVTGKDIETVGYFAFADTTDSYGVVANDPNAGAEEMDDGIVALALSELENPPALYAIRNVSDPQMGGGSLASQKAAAEQIYEKYGYTTTICSALACWAVIAGL